MNRPWWWYVLQIPGLMGFAIFTILVWIAISDAASGASTSIPWVDYLVPWGISGFGWMTGSCIGSWLGALRRGQRKWPTISEGVLFALSVPPLTTFFCASSYLPWWVIIIPIISILAYFLLWWLAPAKKKEEDTDAKSSRVDAAS